MFLPDDTTADSNQYTEGVPGTQVPTRVRADHLNAITNELANAITGMGVDLVKAESDQLSAILVALRTQDLKAAFGAFRMAEDTGSGTTLTSIARRASDRVVSAVGTSASVQVLNTTTMAFGAGSVSGGYTGAFSEVIYDSGFNLFIAAGATGEIQTSAAGSAYTRRANGGANFNAVASRNHLGLGDSAVAVGNSELIKYTLNGTTWNAGVSAFAGTPNITDIICPDAGDGSFLGYWCCTENGDVAYSADDGATWTVEKATAGGSSSGQLAYHPSIGLLYRYGGVVFHSDGGGTWTQIHSGIGTNASILAVQDYWMVIEQAGAPVSIQAHLGITVNSTAAWTVEFIGHSGFPIVLDGQLWAVDGENIWVGGLLA